MNDAPWLNRIVGEGVVAAGDLVAHPQNWRQHPKAQGKQLAATLGGVGWVQRVIVNQRTGRMLDGHLRAELARQQGEQTPVPVVYVDLSEDEERTVLATLDPIANMAIADEVMLAGLVRSIEDADLRSVADDIAATLGIDTSEKPAPVDAEPQIDRAEELRQKWGVELGQMWQLGAHRLICGDCTDKSVVERLMGGEKAILCQADPPYGMGKEKDGIENDNLYREKLDDFQMQWWRACRPFLLDNASAYVWGTAEDLWRLWYRQLKSSERLTFRNEIVWDKTTGQGMGSDAHRMYPTASERCLFFVIGEQGWNNNADNYWDGFTPIVDYLESQRVAMNWSIKDTKQIAGHSEKSGCHWFDKSQWMMPTAETYNAWKAAAKGTAFCREYDDLRREWYATRAPFDNTHTLMTDVWRFDTMRGDDRPDHPTPKPVAMIARIVRTSGTAEAATYDPFSGSGTTLIACEQLGRRCRAVEISPGYVAVALERWAAATGKVPVLSE